MKYGIVFLCYEVWIVENKIKTCYPGIKVKVFITNGDYTPKAKKQNKNTQKPKDKL